MLRQNITLQTMYNTKIQFEITIDYSFTNFSIYLHTIDKWERKKIKITFFDFDFSVSAVKSTTWFSSKIEFLRNYQLQIFAYFAYSLEVSHFCDLLKGAAIKHNFTLITNIWGLGLGTIRKALKLLSKVY